MHSEKRKNYIKGVGCQFYGKVKIGSNSVLGDCVILGYPKESRIIGLQQDCDITNKWKSQLVPKVKLTTIGTNCKIDPHVVIHEGSLIGNGVIIDDFCRIGFDCTIGNNTRIV